MFEPLRSRACPGRCGLTRRIHPASFVRSRPEPDPPCAVRPLRFCPRTRTRRRCRPRPGRGPEPVVTDGVVTASVPRRGNKLYIGGDFDYVGRRRARGRRSARRPEHRHERAACERNDLLRRAESDGAGGWFVGGAFTLVAGAARTNLARFRADGTLDGWARQSHGDGARAPCASTTSLYVGGDLLRRPVPPAGRGQAYDLPALALAPWSPTVLGGPVRALAYRRPPLYLEGEFTSVAGRRVIASPRSTRRPAGSSR